jgi:hypothetical protein
MSKQTALQWLEQEFVKLESTVGVYGVMYELIEQAKQMEKEQIETAWHDGIMGGQCGDSEQYYNETYGGNNEQH